MNRIIVWCGIALSIFLVSCGDTPIEKLYNEGVNLTPTPLDMKINEGKFTLTNNVVFVSPNKDINKVTAYFTAKIQNSTGYNLATVKEKPKSGYINLELVTDLDVNEEGYTLISTTSGIDIKAKTAHGLFYGMQTVMQLLPAEIESSTKVSHIAWNIPAITIKDEPRFKYRGHHIDVCRHFATVDFLKKQIDLLAMFKINTFHWHLTEDQAWRVEIKKYPKLIEIGAHRKEGDGSTYGPFFYTQEEIKDIVAYAAERFVEVIPELELPGHAVAAAAAYPELICTGKPIEVRNYWGVSADAFCAGKEEVFTFLENVVDELAPLFPSKYFHIGGDECIKDRWKVCPKCQARIKTEGLKADKNHTAEEKLQSYFVNRAAKMVEKYGKKMIGWDEILEGGLPESAVVMSWTGEKGGVTAGNLGHDVIMTPGEYMYLDKFQGESKVLPVTIGGVESQNNMLPLSKVYGYEPIPLGLDKDKEHHVLGVQANSWHEYKYTESDMQHDMWPRLIALAEVAWSAKGNKNYDDFLRRLDNQRVRLDMYNVNYYIPRAEQVGVPSSGKIVFIDKATLAFKTTEPVKLVYTTDGTEPILTSTEYKEPLTFSENTVLKIRAVLISDKMGESRTINIEKGTYAPAVEKAANAKSGLLAEYYKGNALQVSTLDGKTPTSTEQVANTTPSKYKVSGYYEVYDDSFYSSVYSGYINIPEDGVYYFSTESELWIDDTQVITNAQNQTTARRFSRNDTSLALAKGTHKFKVVRLGATFGGWPTQWEDVTVSLRKDGEDSFKLIDASYFK